MENEISLVPMSVLYHSQLEKYKDLHSRAHIYIAQGLSKVPGPLYRSKKKFPKVHLVGTLNLCLKMPEKMQKTRNESGHPVLRKPPKTIKNLPKSKLAIFHEFLDVFSAQDDRIHF